MLFSVLTRPCIVLSILSIACLAVVNKGTNNFDGSTQQTVFQFCSQC
jgi:hypothetical protein